jgi:NitT/TauT family transport system substrate-binding protein
MKLKLTTMGRLVIFVIVLAVLGTAAYFGYPLIKDKLPGKSDAVSGKSSTVSGDIGGTAANLHASDGNNVINLSLDEWVGYRTIVKANGGFETQPGSIFDRHGLKVNISVINDPDQSSNALISGSLDAAGYTLNRVAFLSDKFKQAGAEIVFPVFTNYSSGGDGIIARTGINNVTDLVGKKIGVPRFGESHAMLIWFVNNSDLSDAEKREIIDNLILFESASDTGEAFYAGKLDVAATWQPYLSNALDGDDCHIMFSTASSKTLVMSGVAFRKDFAEANPELVTEFIDAIFEANDEPETDYMYLKNVMPMFADSSDEEIKAQFKDAEMTGYAENKKILSETAPNMYATMCGIWESIGETTDRKAGLSMFDDSYVNRLSGQYSSTVVQKDKPSEMTEEKKKQIMNYDSLLSKSMTLEFVADSALFVDPEAAYETMDEFVEIADTLTGAIIQIEGNINSSNTTESGKALSLERANAVAKYFAACGIDPNRIITVGNGNTKMKVDPSSADASANRRTDVFFKIIEE